MSRGKYVVGKENVSSTYLVQKLILTYHDVPHLSCMCLPLVVSWLRFVPDWRNSSRSRGLSTLNSVFCLRHLLHLNHNIEELSLFLTSSLERTCSVNHFLLQSSMRHQELLSSLFSPLGKKLIVFSKISESGKRLYTWIIYHLMIIQTLNLFVYYTLQKFVGETSQ